MDHLLPFDQSENPSANPATSELISSSSKALNVALWAAQIILAATFATAGFVKLTASISELEAMLGWPGQASIGLVRFIGACEVFGAIGLLTPAVTRWRLPLVPLAAMGLGIIMILAIAFHLLRGEIFAILPPLLLALMAGFVAWGRMVRAPVGPRL